MKRKVVEGTLKVRSDWEDTQLYICLDNGREFNIFQWLAKHHNKEVKLTFEKRYKGGKP